MIESLDIDKVALWAEKTSHLFNFSFGILNEKGEEIFTKTNCQTLEFVEKHLEYKLFLKNRINAIILQSNSLNFTFTEILFKSFYTSNNNLYFVYISDFINEKTFFDKKEILNFEVNNNIENNGFENYLNLLPKCNLTTANQVLELFEDNVFQNIEKNNDINKLKTELSLKNFVEIKLNNSIKEIQQLNSKYYTLFNNSPVAVFLMQDCFNDCNDYACVLFDCSKDDIIGKSPNFFSPFLQPDGSQSEKRSTDFINRAIQGETVFFSWQHQTFSKRLIDTEVTLKSIEIEDQIYIQAIVKNVSNELSIQNALLDSEQKMRQITSQISDVIFLTDINGYITFISQSVKKIFGCKESELYGFEFIKLLHPDYVTKTMSALKYTVESGVETKNFELLMQRADGSFFDGEINASQFLKDGKVEGVLGSIRDISERKLISTTLEKNEQRLKEIIDLQGEGLGIVDENEKFIFANVAADKIFGLKRGQLIGRNLREFTSEEEFAKVLMQSSERAKGKQSTYELELILDNQEKRFIQVTVTPQKNLKNKYIGAVGVFRDITTNVVSLKTLSENEEKFRFLLNNTYALISEIDKNGNFTFVNKKFESVLGYKQNELLGKNFASIIHVDDFDKANGDFLRIGQTDEISTIFRIIDKNGNAKWTDNYASKYYDSNNEIKIIIHSFDISDRINNEGETICDGKEIEKLNQELIQINKILEDKNEKINTINHQLEQNEKKFRLIYENSPIPYHSLNDLGCILEINKSWSDTFGYTREEVVGRSFKEFLRQDYANGFEQRFEKFKNIGEIWNTEYVVVTKNNTELIIHINGKFNKDNQGKAIQSHCVLIDVTNSRKSELLLKESEAKYRKLVETSPYGIKIVNLNGEIIYANNKIAKIYGIQNDGENLIGKKAIDFLPSEMREDALKLQQEILQNGFLNNHEYYIVNKSGNIVYCEDYASVIYNDSAEPTSIICITLDITERKKSENQILAQNALLEAALNNMPIEFWARDLDNKMILQSEYSKKLRGDMMNKAIDELSVDYDIKKIWYQNNHKALQGEIVACEQKYILNNQETYIYNVIAPVKIYNEIIGTVGFNIDITNTKLTEIALLENEQLLNDALEYSKIAFFEINPNTNVFKFSKNVFQMFEIENTSSYPLSMEDFINIFVVPEEKEKVLRVYQFSLKAKKSIEADFNILVSKTYIIKTLRAKIHHIFNNNKEFVKVLITLQDVTTLKASNDLRINVEIAQKSAKLKQQFLANMSHEIRTPLIGIIGMLEFLAKTKLNEEQIDYIQTIKNSSDTLINIVNDILDLSKIEEGKLKLNPVPVKITDIKERVQKIFNSLKNNKPIVYKATYDFALPEVVEVDVNRVCQIVNNLISNAVKFTEKGHIHVRFKQLEKLDDEYIVLKVEVEDSGIGVSEEDKEKIFNKFTQLDSSISKTYEGSGLGLTISKDLVALMNGEIGVESQIGRGSTFWFTINVKIFNADPIVKSYNSENIISNPKFNAKILLVEDKVVNQKVINMMLQNAKCDVTIANNGQEALDVFKIDYFDLIFMDISMPIMDGITTVKELKKRYDFLPPIIGLSANALEGDAERFISEGLDDYLAKPVTSEQLYDKMSMWIRKKEIE